MAKATYKHNLRWDITKLKASEKVLSVFPELQAYEVFSLHGSGDNDCWLRFAFYYADKGSGLQIITELHRKRVEALRLAGINADDARAKKVLDGWKNKEVVLLVNEVVRLMHSRNYTAWYHGSEHYHQSFENMSKEVKESDGKDFTILMKEGYQLEELEKKLFMSDEDLAKAQKEIHLQAAGAVARRSLNQTFVEHDDDDEEED
jgi:hypothetical protein